MDNREERQELRRFKALEEFTIVYKTSNSIFVSITLLLMDL
jgi:hypothetical protein